MDGYCMQNFKMSAPVVAEPSPSQKQKIDPYHDLPVHPDQPHPCFICLEPVSRADDALFDCSYYVNGKGACVLHHECGKMLRKLECPGCRCPITTFRKIPRDIIEPRAEKDKQDRLAEAARLPNVQDLMEILFAGRDTVDVDDNDDNDLIFRRRPNEDELLTFALEFLPTMVDRDLLHAEMHRKYIYAICSDIDTAIVGAEGILGNDE